MESGLEGISCLWKSLYKSGQNLTVDLSDNVNEVGSILPSTVQTELIEKSAHCEDPEICAYCEYHGHVPSNGT